MKMRLSVLAVMAFFLVSGVAAESVNAVISPSSPDDILLQSPDWAKNKTYDGSGSTGDSISYSWLNKDTSVSKSGPEINYTFDRDSSQTSTIELTVSNATESDVTSVTQVVHDVPNITLSSNESSATGGDGDLDFGDKNGNNNDKDSDNSIPVSFSSSVTNEFDDPVSYNWTVDGKEQSTSSSFEYSFSEPSSSASFTVELNVTDDAGYFASSSVTIDTDNETSDSSSSSSSSSSTSSSTTSSSGGATASTSSSEEKSKVTVNFGVFLKGDTEEKQVNNNVVKKLSMTAASDLFDQVKATIESTSDRPDSVSQSPSRTTYRYLEIEKENVTDSDINSTEFTFEVEESWIDENSIEKSSVALERYKNGWNTLDTTLEEESNGTITYTAESPGFSVFAITGDARKPNFKVQNITLNSSQVSQGEAVLVEVEVENTGDASGSYTVSFDVNGTSYTKDLSLNAGERKTASFNVEASGRGTVQLNVGGKSAELEVVSTGSEGIDENLEGDLSGTPWKVVAGFVGLLVLIAGGVLAYTETDMEIEPLEELLTDLKNSDVDSTTFEGFGDVGAEDEEDEDGFDYSYD